MKLRTGFVSNSSSSSFTIAYHDVQPTSYRERTEELYDFLAFVYGYYGELEDISLDMFLNMEHGCFLCCHYSNETYDFPSESNMALIELNTVGNEKWVKVTPLSGGALGSYKADFEEMLEDRKFDEED